VSEEAAPVALTGRWESPSRQAGVRRLVWTIVLVALTLWVVLAISAVRWGSATWRLAAAPVPTTIEQVNGVVLYREADQARDASAASGTQVFEHDTVVTSFGSSANLRFFDGSLVQLFPNSRLEVNTARIGRFNSDSTQLSFTLVQGAIRMEIPQILEKPYTVNVVTPNGASAFVPGEYTLRVGDDGTRISVWDGRTAAAVGSQTIEIATNQKILLSPGNQDFRVVGVLEDVIANGNFATGFGSWEPWEDREEGRPDVPGIRQIVRPTESGAPSAAARFTRTSELDSHNETGLRQALGVNVSGARSIVLHALVKVDSASLSGGGYLGTEYPMMLRLRYRDSRGAGQIWTMGFYYANPENRPTPLGDSIKRGVWTDYAVDLAQFRSPPEIIDSIEVFGAGHTFDASVADVRLLVD
jgi:hypothetical protein